MSQDTFPFAPGEEAAPFEDGDSDRNKKALLAAGGVIALLLGAGAYFLLGSGGEAEDEAFVPVKRAPRAVAAAPVPKAAAKKLPVAYKEQLGRDPFRALYVVPAAAPAAPAAPAAAPVAPAAPTTTGTTSAGTGAAPAAPVTKRYTLKLTAISNNGEARLSTWSVDGTKTTVLPAQRFGKYGELVVLAFTKNAQGVVDGAILQVGDDSPMDVKLGESNSVL